MPLKQRMAKIMKDAFVHAEPRDNDREQCDATCSKRPTK